jgi:hypothetical protein
MLTQRDTMLANVLKRTVIRSPRGATPTLSRFSNSTSAPLRPYRTKAKRPLVSGAELALSFNSPNLL